MAEKPKFQIVEQTTEDEGSESASTVAAHALMLGLRALSQRAVAAIADLFMLATVGSAFWLWWLTPKPDVYQIVSLTIYALFVLAANYIVRRK